MYDLAITKRILSRLNSIFMLLQSYSIAKQVLGSIEVIKNKLCWMIKLLIQWNGHHAQ